MEHKQLSIEIYDFQWRLINTLSVENSDKISLSVDEEMNELLKSNVYYVLVKVIDETTTKIVNKFYLIIN
jgi:hypothetical protein